MVKYISTVILTVIIGIAIVLSPLQASRSSQAYYEDQVAVLMYHHIHDRDKSSGTITSTLFREQLQYLADKGYQFITLEEFKQYMQGSTVPANAVLITFDDGYLSFYQHAYPLLRERLVPAVNFIITNDMDNPDLPYIPVMTKEHIAEMTHATNFIDAQCHTNAQHYKLKNGQAALVGRLDLNGTPEKEEQYEQRIKDDADVCRSKLSALYENPIDTYAYPYGITNRQASFLIAERGFRYAFTVIPGMATRASNPLTIPRINAGSPHITPELLHHTIQRNIVARSGKAPRIDLSSAIEQLGGNVRTVNKDVEIRLHDMQITVRVNSRDALNNGSSLKLREPVALYQGKVVIALDDLEKITQLKLIYDLGTQKITRRVLPKLLHESIVLRIALKP